MAAMCKTSAIEGVCIVMGDKFPPAAHEAEQDDPELPRVAAMWFPATATNVPAAACLGGRTGEICKTCERALTNGLRQFLHDKFFGWDIYGGILMTFGF